ncbi:MAG: SDR family oxidoreductase [bacterium]
MRVAFVSGNVKGIGKAITLRLLKMGYVVPIHYRNSYQEALDLREFIKNEYKIEVPLYKADLTKEDEVTKILEEMIKIFPSVDTLVNNVGDYMYKNLLELTFEEWKYIIDSNLNTAFLITSNFLKYVRRRIIFIGFAGSYQVKAYPYTTAYNIAKTGLLIYAKSLAKLLADRNITVNVVGVGVAENSVTKPIEEIPMKRTATLEEICDLVEFLVSPRSDYITGQLVEIAGGWKL